MKLKSVIQLPDAAKTCRVVKVSFDDETEEYVCQLFISGGHYEPADYFTSDYDDAIGTAKQMCIDPNRIQTKAERYLSDMQFAGYSSATMIDGANAKCIGKGNQGDIYHWIFPDNSFLYFNANNNGWTV